MLLPAELKRGTKAVQFVTRCKAIGRNFDTRWTRVFTHNDAAFNIVAVVYVYRPHLTATERKYSASVANKFTRRLVTVGETTVNC